MNPFTTKGRISVKEYAWNMATSIAIYIGVIKLSLFLIDDLQGESKFFYYLGFIILFTGVLYFIISLVCFTSRRLQDMGKPGSNFIMLLIPLYNLYLIMLLFSQIGFGNNIYGPEIAKSEVSSRVYFIRIISIVVLITISDIYFNFYNDRLLQTFLKNPAKNDLYIIETDPIGKYRYQLFDIINISENQIELAVGSYNYLNVSNAKNDIENKKIREIGYFKENVTINRDTLKSKKIERIIRFYKK